MSASVAHSEYEMSSCVSRQRSSFSEMQPFCWIMSGAHSFFQTCKALSISDGSIVMWISRIMDINHLHRAGWTARVTIGNKCGYEKARRVTTRCRAPSSIKTFVLCHKNYAANPPVPLNHHCDAQTPRSTGIMPVVSFAEP